MDSIVYYYMDQQANIVSEYRNKIFVGDCLETMRRLPSGIVQCTCTSPPYFALRSYLPDGHPDKAKEIGSEPTPDAFIATMVAVFREVRRIMRDDGVLFMNLGDSYNQYNAGQTALPGTLSGNNQHARQNRPEGLAAADCGVGQLLNIPHRVAEALRADGWNWRQTIIWAKKSPMPESMKGWRWEPCKIKASNATYHDTGKNADHIDRRKVGFNDRYDNPDEHAAKFTSCPGCKKCLPNGGLVLRQGKGRCTNSHEYIFVLTKGEGYFWDSEASKEATAQPERAGKLERTFSTGDTISTLRKDSGRSVMRTESRNPRSVWLLSTESTKQKHYATFPSELVRRCLVAGTSAGGCCETCRMPWSPIVESESVATRPGDNHKATIYGKSEANTDPQRKVSVSKLLGYRQSCKCPTHAAAKQIVFDPFTGLGTVQQTARQLGHDWLGTELNPEYAAIAERRIYETPRWLLRQQAAEKKPGKKNHKAAAGQRSFNF